MVREKRIGMREIEIVRGWLSLILINIVLTTDRN